MIDAISSSSKHLQVINGEPNTYIPNNAGMQGVGMMRYNTSTQKIEIYDGINWMMLNKSTAFIQLSPETESLLDWAKQKREEEMNWQNLAENNKAVKIALDNLEEARRQLEVTTKLIKEHEQRTG